MRYLTISDIKLPYTADDAEIIIKARDRLRRAGIRAEGLAVYKKSLDARNKNAIQYVSTVICRTEHKINAERAAVFKLHEIPDPYAELAFPRGKEVSVYPPLVVGMGPCGMFAALLLARHGYKPTVIDRGGSIAERVRAVEKFTKNQVLDTETNVQFGAGGAGTFSDGKLVTRIRDAACSYVLKTFHEHGASDSILTSAKPHIGTDVLRSVVDSILSEIESLGGRVIYNCRLDGITEKSDGCVAHTTKGDIAASSVVLATGHSANDTYGYLMRAGYPVLPKSFSVGVRIEHLRADVERSLYGELAGDKRLPAAEYAVSDTRGERGVYTFCMCPGGYVMASASEEGGVVTNGMSEYSRDGVNSNSAMLVSVTPEDFGNSIDRAIEFKRMLERQAFSLGGNDYGAPIITADDFKKRRCVTEPARILPTYMDGKTRLAPLYDAMPQFLYDGLCRGLESFSAKLECFGDGDAVLTGFETRTSSPLRIMRTSEMSVPCHDRIYPCGEGAGYAGGITSAACDGIHAAEKIIGRFAPIEQL